MLTCLQEVLTYYKQVLHLFTIGEHIVFVPSSQLPVSIYRKSVIFERGESFFFCEEQTMYGSSRLGTEQVEHSMRGLVSNDALTDEITRAREQHGEHWQERLQEQYEGRFYERLQDAWGNEWSTRLDLLLQGNNDGWLVEQIRNESYTLQAGTKRYELANHLGNVLAVVSDKKVQTDGVVWQAEVVSAQDYFPFGMAMPGRTTDAKHRYGFNGKETDPETGIQDYGMRWYLPNIARFPSVDPITKQYPMLTPYQFASNTPIQAVDWDGAEARYYLMANNNVSYQLNEKVSKLTGGLATPYFERIGLTINKSLAALTGKESENFYVSQTQFSKGLTDGFPQHFGNYDIKEWGILGSCPGQCMGKYTEIDELAGYGQITVNLVSEPRRVIPLFNKVTFTLNSSNKFEMSKADVDKYAHELALQAQMDANVNLDENQKAALLVVARGKIEAAATKGRNESQSSQQKGKGTLNVTAIMTGSILVTDLYLVIERHAFDENKKLQKTGTETIPIGHSVQVAEGGVDLSNLGVNLNR